MLLDFKALKTHTIKMGGLWPLKTLWSLALRKDLLILVGFSFTSLAIKYWNMWQNGNLYPKKKTMSSGSKLLRESFAIMSYSALQIWRKTKERRIQYIMYLLLHKIIMESLILGKWFILEITFLWFRMLVMDIIFVHIAGMIQIKETIIQLISLDMAKKNIWHAGKFLNFDWSIPITCAWQCEIDY